jgi:hypothetical protein
MGKIIGFIVGHLGRYIVAAHDDEKEPEHRNASGTPALLSPTFYWDG